MKNPGVATSIRLLQVCLLAVGAVPCGPVQGESIAWRVRTIHALSNVTSSVVYDVDDLRDGIYNHHPAIACIDGRLVVIWSNHLRGFEHGADGIDHGEDGPGQQVLCATSTNGMDWSAAVTLQEPLGPYGTWTNEGRIATANGFARHGDALYAIVEVNDNQSKHHFGACQRAGVGRLARRVFPDGGLGPVRFWLWPPVPSLPGFRVYPDPRASAIVRDTAAALVAYLARPPHQPAWDFCSAAITNRAGDIMVEPSTFQRPDGSLVTVYRGGPVRSGESSLYAAESTDGGATFTVPMKTDIQDSPSKSISGTLADGRVYLIGNFHNEVPYRRDPLVLAISHDGTNFTWAASVRGGAPPVDFPAVNTPHNGKGPGYQYPSAVVVDGVFHLVYSIGKEDIGYSCFPVPTAAETGGDLVL